MMFPRPFDSQSETLGDRTFANFWLYGQNPKVWPFIGKLESCSAALYCGAVFFFFQFYRVCKFEKCINFGLSTVRSETVSNTPWRKLMECTITRLGFLLLVTFHHHHYQSAAEQSITSRVHVCLSAASAAIASGFRSPTASPSRFWM